MADRLAGELDLAIVELRGLARRLLTPAALDNGVVAAVRGLAEIWPIRVTVHARSMNRHPPDVELAVYNCCLEALQNVADHGGSDASAVVRLVERRAGIHFVVSDNGIGFDPANTERGPGLTRIIDRAILAGGCATIRSAPGRGVRVSGLIPTKPAAHAA
jgi:signal transduction histidine kinase